MKEEYILKQIDGEWFKYRGASRDIEQLRAFREKIKNEPNAQNSTFQIIKRTTTTTEEVIEYKAR